MTIAQINNCKKLTEKLNQEKYTIKFILFYKTSSLEDLIKYATTLVNNNIPPTKKVGENKRFRERQDLGGSRSLKDLFFLSKHYFPEVTVEDIVKVLLKFNEGGHLNKWFCTTHGKQMYRYEIRGYNVRYLYNLKYGI